MLDEADVFLLPSVTGADGNMEGIPVALMEAMAVGIPVVSTLPQRDPGADQVGSFRLAGPRK